MICSCSEEVNVSVLDGTTKGATNPFSGFTKHDIDYAAHNRHDTKIMTKESVMLLFTKAATISSLILLCYY